MDSNNNTWKRGYWWRRSCVWVCLIALGQKVSSDKMFSDSNSESNWFVPDRTFIFFAFAESQNPPVDVFSATLNYVGGFRGSKFGKRSITGASFFNHRLLVHCSILFSRARFISPVTFVWTTFFSLSLMKWWLLCFGRLKMSTVAPVGWINNVYPLLVSETLPDRPFHPF